jgi:hypothetical protein
MVSQFILFSALVGDDLGWCGRNGSVCCLQINAVLISLQVGLFGRKAAGRRFYVGGPRLSLQQ